MPLAEVNGGKLNYMTLSHKGAGPGENLVMMHGLAANMGFWLQAYAQHFAQRCNVTLYDMRGHGRSKVTETGYTPDNLAADLSEFMNEQGIDKTHIIAHSFGGIPALQLAAAQTDRILSLTLLDTHIGLGRHMAQECKWITGENVQKALDECGIALDVQDPFFGFKIMTEVARFQRDGKDIPEKLKPWVRHFLDGNSMGTSRKWLTLMEETSALDELTSDDGLDEKTLQKITCPVLAMYGEKSQALPSGKRLSSLLPDSEFILVNDAGHFFPKSKPDLVMAACENFWDHIKDPVRRRA